MPNCPREMAASLLTRPILAAGPSFLAAIGGLERQDANARAMH